MVKRVKVSRVHIPDWDDGELMFMLMEKRVWAFFSRNPLYFSFLKVKANVYTVRPRYNEHSFNEFFTYEQKIWIPIFL